MRVEERGGERGGSELAGPHHTESGHGLAIRDRQVYTLAAGQSLMVL